METTLALIDLAGYTAMLLWGLHIVRKGIMQAFGAHIRYYLGVALKGRVQALFTGFTATMFLQSSIAVILMATSLTAKGLIDLVPSLALMLGANVGSTVLVQIFSFNINHIAPILLLIGLVGFRQSRRMVGRKLSSALIGVGLMLFALSQMLVVLHQAEASEGFQTLLGLFTQHYLLNIFIGLVLSWSMHSSVAIVLLAMSFATQNLISLNEALALVLGANLGSAINPLFETSFTRSLSALRLPLGNFINRVTGCLLAIPFFSLIDDYPNALGSTAAHAVANFHTLFNIIMAILFFPILGPLARLLSYLLKDRGPINDPAQALYLDMNDQAIPEKAISNAAKEALRMTEIIENMLGSIALMLEKEDLNYNDEVLKADDVLKRLGRKIEIYVSSLGLMALKPEEQKRADAVLNFVISMKNASNVIVRSLAHLAIKKIEQHLAFTQAEWNEMQNILQRVRDNAKLAATVFMTRETNLARQLLDEKGVLRDHEVQAKYAHFSHLHEGTPEYIETSALKLDILSNLKRINSYFASNALSVLQKKD